MPFPTIVEAASLDVWIRVDTTPHAPPLKISTLPPPPPPFSQNLTHRVWLTYWYSNNFSNALSLDVPRNSSTKFVPGHRKAVSLGTKWVVYDDFKGRKLVKNPNWLDADQWAIYCCSLLVYKRWNSWMGDLCLLCPKWPCNKIRPKERRLCEWTVSRNSLDLLNEFLLIR